MRTLRTIAASWWVHLRNTVARPMFQVVVVFQPLAIGAITYYLYRRSTDPTALMYVIFGGGLSGAWSGIVFSSAGDIGRERGAGTLTPLAGSPASLYTIFVGKLLANALLTVVSLVISVTFSLIMLQVPLGAARLDVILIGLVVYLFGASTFALCLSALFMLSHSTLILQNFLEYPLMLLGGVMFSPSLLPAGLEVISRVLPLRWGADILRSAFDPTATPERIATQIAWGLGLGVLYAFVARGLFRVMTDAARRAATLEFV